MDTLKISISQIKNIKTGVFEFPLENSLNLIVGSNGSGKSTFLLSLSQAILAGSLKTLKSEDYSSSSIVEIEIDGVKDCWKGDNDWYLKNINIKLNGMYEGSLFYGTRFNDSKKIDEILHKGLVSDSDIVDADDYIKQKASYILHGVDGRYPNLKRIKNRYISAELGFTNTPYFNFVNSKLISQYRMSSGECLLISLLHFIYNAIVRRSLPTDKIILVLVDEIELALHPIAVSRFIDLMQGLVEENRNLMVILTSHSPEVIQKIKPKNIYKIENNEGIINVVNPGFPSYVIRDVYRHDGFDFLFLVEDELAKVIVDKILEINNFKVSKLIHVVPVGGWENVLKLQRDLLANNILGIGKEVISIIDGDVQSIIPIDYKDLRKLFLPIKSIEKYLYEILVEKPNFSLKKIINDKYFTVQSIDTIVSEFHERYPGKIDHPDKKLYFRLRKNLEARRIDETLFINKLADDIMSIVSFSSFNLYRFNSSQLAASGRIKE
ncbi:MAG: ATP-dependent nuclease [Candidatus Nanopelagicales bacterium]